MHAISEMRALTKLTTDNTEGFFKLSTLHYQVKMKTIRRKNVTIFNFFSLFQLGEGEESLNVIRECLKLDPEHKDCYPFYKKVKKVAKFLIAAQEAQNNQDWQECIDASQKILKNEPKVSKLNKKYFNFATK